GRPAEPDADGARDGDARVGRRPGRRRVPVGSAGMHRWRNQLTVAVVAFFLGLLVVGQLRAQQGGAGMAGLSAQDLTVLIANLNARNDQLRQETRMLERDVATLAGNQARGQTSVDQIRLDLSRVRAWAGL